MKKTILSILTIMALTSSSYALDISSDSSQADKTDIDKANNFKQGSDNKTSQAERHTNTSTSDQSFSQSKETSIGSQYKFLLNIMNYERNGDEPFASCSVLTKPKLVADFGLTAEDANGDYDTIFSDILQKAANSNSKITKVGADEYAIKDYINCVSYYGAIIAQGMQRGIYSTEIKDQKILKTFHSVQNALATNTCRFSKSTEKIVCGAVNITIDTTPNVTYSSIPLYSDQTFYGFNGKASINSANSQRLAFERQRQKETVISDTVSQDSSVSFKVTAAEDVSSKSSFSPRNWLPK